jgi:hypothetical protein
MSRTIYKVVAIVFLATVLLGVALLSTSPSYAASRTSTSSTVATQSNTALAPSIIGKLHCGWASCSYYFTRHSTRVIAVEGLAASGYLAHIPFTIASYIRLIVALVDAKAWEAYLKNQCLRVRVGLINGLYSDGSGYCLN